MEPRETVRGARSPGCNGQANNERRAEIGLNVALAFVPILF
jgi:hypothetical protein